MPTMAQRLAGRVSRYRDPRAAHAMLLREEKAAKERLAELERLRKQIEQQAVADGLAFYVEGPRRELPPTKEMFIARFGVDIWKQMVRLSEPTRKFMWSVVSEVRKHA